MFVVAAPPMMKLMILMIIIIQWHWGCWIGVILGGLSLTSGPPSFGGVPAEHLALISTPGQQSGRNGRKPCHVTFSRSYHLRRRSEVIATIPNAKWT